MKYACICLWCGEVIYRPQNVPVIFLNRSITSEDMDKSKVPRFYGPRCTFRVSNSVGLYDNMTSDSSPPFPNSAQFSFMANTRNFLITCISTQITRKLSSLKVIQSNFAKNGYFQTFNFSAALLQH